MFQAADPVQAWLGIFGTNPSCATCIISCVERKGVASALACIQSCQHQAENRCDASTGLLRLAPLVGSAALDNRDSLVRLVLSAESDCKPPPPLPDPFSSSALLPPGPARFLARSNAPRSCVQGGQEPRSKCAHGGTVPHICMKSRLLHSEHAHARMFDRTWSDPRVCASCTCYDCGFRRVLHPRHDRERLRRAMRPR